MITGTTRLFFMIAHPIEHVRSPEILNAAFTARGIDAVMVPLHFHPGDFRVGWEGMRKMQNLGGMIISVPLKEAAFQLCDDSDETAARLGAANSVRRDPDGRMTCANFDGAGFLAGMLRGGEDARGRHALLVGAGGAGVSIAFALAGSGIASIRIADSLPEKAERLAAALRSHASRLDVTTGPAHPAGCDLIINATPCGLYPDHDPLPVDVQQLAPGMIVADIIMKPRVTPLLSAAERAGCDVRHGAGMLDSQVELMLRFFGY